jgi:hypothetical protein
MAASLGNLSSNLINNVIGYFSTARSVGAVSEHFCILFVDEFACVCVVCAAMPHLITVCCVGSIGDCYIIVQQLCTHSLRYGKR